MSLGKLVKCLALAAVLIPAFGCGGHNSGSRTNTILSAVQDVTLDPDGTSTVLTFASDEGLSGAGLTNFQTDGSQTATSVSVVASTVTVTWNARVSPADQVRAIGLSDVSTAFAPVTPSTSAAPTFTIQNGTQTPSLGGDTFDVEFSGPYVIESEVEDLDNWTLTVNSTVLDLAGSTIVFDTNTQTAAVTLGLLANLHADFTLEASGIHAVTDVLAPTTPVAGTASGDTAAPTLVAATQNLTEDEFGRVIDFQFSEPMDPVFSVQLSHFGVTTPDIATAVDRPASDTLRVTFNNPIVPGVNTVSLSGLVDAHGNDFVDAVVGIAQGAAVVNAYDALEANTVTNTGGDYITVQTTQALDPDSAILPASWALVVDSNSIDLSTQTLGYDLATKTLTITLDFDMLNGDSFSVTGVSALDVDGDTFALGSGGTVAGDATLPTVGTVVQNRNIDVTGKTVVVQFSEDVDATTAQNTANYSISGAQNLQSATILAGADSVRLEYDAFVVPGDDTLSIQNVLDLAGNVMTAAPFVAIATTDSSAPSVLTVSGQAVEGSANDVVQVTFDDDMIPAEATDWNNWHIESPVGMPITLAANSVGYDVATRTATLQLASQHDLQRGDDLGVSFSNCRDIGGNTITATSVTGSVSTETTLPNVISIWRDATNLDQLVVVFDEPVQNADSLFNLSTNPGGSSFVLRDSGGTVRGTPNSAVVASSNLAVRLLFGFIVNPTDTLDTWGVVDTCGNPMFPELTHAIVAEDTAEPDFFPGSSSLSALSGENNDVVLIVFDRLMNPFGITDPANYTMTGATSVDLSNALFRFDGFDTVTIGLKNATGNDLVPGDLYAITVDDVWSAQGIQLTSTATMFLNAGGDTTVPTVGSTDVRIDPSTANSLIVTADEALWTVSSDDPAFYDYNSGNIATSASRVGPRSVRVTFAVQPTVGGSLSFSVFDLAQNSSGSITRTVAASDTTAPLVASVVGGSISDLGKDTVKIVFDEPVDASTALNPANYLVTNGLRTLDPFQSRPTYESATNTVTFTFAPGSELDTSASLTVKVQNVADFSGNVMPSQVTLTGAVVGDTIAPAFHGAFVNWRVDPTGKTIDVLFDEDVDQTLSSSSANWTASGGPSVSTVTFLEADHYRVLLSSALGASGTVGITYVEDLAANFASTITVDPLE